VEDDDEYYELWIKGIIDNFWLFNGGDLMNELKILIHHISLPI
jgi:hypothetical protein